MKRKKYIALIILSYFVLISCNTVEREREEKYTLEKNKQEVSFNEIIQKYSPIIFDAESLNNKFSYELEKEYSNKTLAISAYIIDIKKIDNENYLAFVKNDSQSFILNIDNKILDKIITSRNQLLMDEKEWFDLDYTEFIFIINPTAFIKKMGLFKYVDDYYIIEDELEDYVVNLELENDGFLIKGEGVDVILATYLNSFDL